MGWLRPEADKRYGETTMSNLLNDDLGPDVELGARLLDTFNTSGIA